MKWDEFLINLADEAGTLAKTELIDLVKTSIADGDEFISKQGTKMRRYLQQLADGKITKSEFELYMEDLKNLLELEALRLAVAAKARAQRIADGIQSLVLDSLLKLI